MRFWHNVRPLYIPSSLPTVYLTFRSEDIRHKVSNSSKNRTNVKLFGPQFFGRDDPDFLWQIISAIYCSPFGKVWLSSVCRSPSVKPGNEVECSRLWTKVRDILRRYMRPLLVSNALARVYIYIYIYRVSF